MRRLSSIFASLAVLATGLTLATPVASANAAPGKATTRNAPIVAPSAVPNPLILRMQRLNQSNAFLVVGIDTVTPGANAHVWRMKDDLTIDTSFPAVNLGDEFELPTAGNSICMSSQNSSNCWALESFVVNETAGSYAVAMRRQFTIGSGMNSRSENVTSFAIGNLRTGAVTAKRIFALMASPLADPADFAPLNATVLGPGVCTSRFGTTYQGVALSVASISSWSTILRPDSSLQLSLWCQYAVTSGSTRTDYETRGAIVLRASGSSIVQDTTFGTNGVVTIFDDPTRCGQNWDIPSVDSSVTSLTSPKVYTISTVMFYARRTQWPHGGNTVTSYNGCQTSGAPVYTGTSLTARKADGSALATTTFNTATGPSGRWLIDTEGRWNNLVSSANGNTVNYSLFRVNTKGEPDTTLGPNGLKALPNMPATVTVNGTTVNMRYNLLGIAATRDGFMFTGFSSAGMPMSIMCNQPFNYELSTFPYYLNPDTGLVTSYGTNGLGEAMTYTAEATCGGTGGAGASFINAKGQHSSVVVLRALGSQAAGFRYTVWEPAAGVTSGGDGSGVVGGASAAGRVDTRVYSTRLPQVAQPDSALRVLTAKQAEDLDIRTSTPRICVALTTSVLMVNPGRCTVRIIDEDTRRVIRTMTTTVKKAEVEEGTTLTTDEPIMFRQASTTLSRTARAQVAELATAAANAGRVVVIGHSAALGDVSPFSFAISRDRATAVRNALIRAGVKAPIEIVALSYNQPERTAKTEAAQAKNRRVEVFIFPK